MKSFTNKRLQQGASLIEILVTMFILAIGLLGVAGMQSAGLRQTMASQMDIHAQLLVQDLVEMIVASDFEGDGDYEFSGVPVMGTDCSATECNNAQLAQYNVWLWGENMQPELPNFALDISFDAATSQYTISLTWNAERLEAADYTAPTCTLADNASVGCFAMAFEV